MSALWQKPSGTSLFLYKPHNLLQAFAERGDVLFKDHYPVVLVGFADLFDSLITRYFAPVAASFTSKKYVRLPALTLSENNSFLPLT